MRRALSGVYSCDNLGTDTIDLIIAVLLEAIVRLGHAGQDRRFCLGHMLAPVTKNAAR